MTITNVVVGSSANQIDAAVVSPPIDKRGLVDGLNGKGGHANCIIKFYPAHALGETTVATAASSAATAIVLDGDASVKNTLNGRAVTNADFLLVSTDSGWQLCTITTVNAGGANATIALSVIAGTNGEAGLMDDVAEDAVAYIVRAEDTVTIPVGAATIANYRNVFCSQPGRPFAVGQTAGDASAHYASAIVKFVA